MTTKTTVDVTVLFHENCADGLASACAMAVLIQDCKSANDDNLDINTRYVPVTYAEANQPEFEPVKVKSTKNNTIVVCVDFSLRPGLCADLLSKGISVIILDHHKYTDLDAKTYATLQEATNGQLPTPTDHFVNNRGKFVLFNKGNDLGSGVLHVNAFANLHGFEHSVKFSEWYISDRDTWKTENTRAFMFHEVTHNRVVALAKKHTKGEGAERELDMFSFYYEREVVFLDYFSNQTKWSEIATELKTSRRIAAANHVKDHGLELKDAIIVNGMRFIDEEVVDYILRDQKKAVAAIVRMYVDGSFEVSFRSKNGEALSVARIFGATDDSWTAGGHNNAAGVSGECLGDYSMATLRRHIESSIETHYLRESNMEAIKELKDAQ